MRVNHSSNGTGFFFFGFFVFGFFFLVISLIAFAFIYKKYNSKKTKMYVEKNGLNYKPRDPQIIEQFTPYYNINLKTFNTNIISEVITGIKNNIKITMFTAESPSGETTTRGRTDIRVNFKHLTKGLPEDFRKTKKESMGMEDEGLTMAPLLPMNLQMGSTILKFDGDLKLPKFRLNCIWTPPQFLTKLAGVTTPGIPDYAIKFNGLFGKYFYLDYYEDDSIRSLFSNEEVFEQFIAQCNKKKNSVITAAWSFNSFGDTVIIDYSMPTNASIRIDILETSLKLLVILQQQARSVA